MNGVAGEPIDGHVDSSEDEDDLVLHEVIPYCSDPGFVRSELARARLSGDPLAYLEGSIAGLEGSRKVDIRILLNRLAMSRR